MPALDGVRGLAILAVLLYHFIAITARTNPFEAAVDRVLGFGELGVDLFFVLSGFLITGILYDSRTSASYYRTFYMRRVLRIFPLYYGVLFVIFFVLPLVPALRGSEIVALRDHQWWAWLYGVNIWLSIKRAWVLSYIRHFWSLAVEEHFYLVWPFIVYWLSPRPRTLMKTALVVAGLSVAGRVWLSLAGVSSIVSAVLTPFQLDALCLGGFFAVCVRQPDGLSRVRRAIVPMAVASAVFGLGAFGLGRVIDGGELVGRPLMTLAIRVLLASVLLRALTAPAGSWTSVFFGSRALRMLGKYSYGLYVYHHFAAYYFITHGTEFALAGIVGSHTLAVLCQAAAGIAASIAVAWLSYEYFERPFLTLKRLWPSATEGAQAMVAHGTE